MKATIISVCGRAQAFAKYADARRRISFACLSSLFSLLGYQVNSLILESVTIENGVGPSNVTVFHEADRDVIISANREKAEAALYFVRD